MNDYEARKAARAARLREWAANATSRAAAASTQASQMASVIPLGQPILVGHHSERRDRRYRDRISRRYEAARDEQDKADRLNRKAAAIENDTSISRDDPDAIAKLDARIAEERAKLERRKAINAEIRKGTLLADLDLTEIERNDLRLICQVQPYYGEKYPAKTIYPPYAISNLSSNIRRLEQRRAQLAADALKVAGTGRRRPMRWLWTRRAGRCETCRAGVPVSARALYDPDDGVIYCEICGEAKEAEATQP